MWQERRLRIDGRLTVIEVAGPSVAVWCGFDTKVDDIRGEIGDNRRGSATFAFDSPRFLVSIPRSRAAIQCRSQATNVCFPIGPNIQDNGRGFAQ